MAVALPAFATDYYVDAVSGSDANSGIATNAAWKTLTNINANNAPFVAGDTISFRSGQTWTDGPLEVKKSGGAGNPITYRIYDGTNAAVIKTIPTTKSGLLVSAKDYITLSSLKIEGPWDFANLNKTNVTTSYHGLEISGACSGLVLTNLEVTGFSGRGIDFNNSGQVASSNRMVNCHVHHVGIAGIRVKGKWAGERTINHENLYLAHCVVSHTAGGTDNNHKASGIEISQARDVLIEYCEARYTGLTSSIAGGGPVGIWGWDCDRLVIQYCYAHHNTTAAGPDGGGFDLDGGCTGSIVQYCYSHDNGGPGQFIAHFGGSHPTTNNIIRYNISLNDSIKQSQGALNFWGGGSYGYVYGNVVIGGTKSGHLVVLESGASNTKLYNNIFITTGNNYILRSANSSNITYRNNCWWSTTGQPKFLWGTTTNIGLTAWRASSGQEIEGGTPTGQELDPQLVGGGTGPTNGLTPATLPTMLDAFKLSPLSPMRDIGRNMAALFGAGHPGTRDFYGTAIPQNGDYDIGAHESTDPLPAPPAAPTGSRPPPLPTTRSR